MGRFANSEAHTAVTRIIFRGPLEVSSPTRTICDPPCGGVLDLVF